VNNKEFNKWTDRQFWLVDLPPNVLAKPADPKTFTNLIFFTGSFTKFRNKHDIVDIKAAIMLRKLVNDAYKFDENDVLEWYRNTVFDNFDLDLTHNADEMKVDANCLDVNIDLNGFKDNYQFKMFLESTLIFVNAL
jgi:hypothetical protein